VFVPRGAGILHETVQQVFLCALLAALTTLAVAATLFVRAATATVAAVPAEIRLTRAALVHQADAARHDLSNQLAAARVAAFTLSDRQATAFRTGILAQTAGFGDAASRQLGGTLSRIDTALATTASLERELRPTLRHSAAIAAQIDDSLPCSSIATQPRLRVQPLRRRLPWHRNRATDVSGMSRDFRRDWPAISKTWQDIGVQTDGFVANMNRLTHRTGTTG